MAATADKYSVDTWNDKDNTSTSPATKQIYAYLPLALTEYTTAADAGKSYSQMTDAEKKDDNGFCEKFFCDSVMKFKDSEGKDCVVGLLDVDHPMVQDVWQRSLDLHIRNEGGASRSRQGKLMINKNGTNYMVLNDGGLNTKPFIEIGSPIVLCACTYCVLRIDSFRNAYYFNTNTWRLKIELFQNQSVYPATSYLSSPSHTDYMRIEQDDLLTLRGTSGTDVYVSVDLLRTSISEAAIGDKFRFTFMAYNDETYGVNNQYAQPFLSNKTGALNAPVYGQEGIVDRNVRPLVVWKVTNLNDNPTEDGTPYTILFDDTFYALKSVAGGLGLLENGDTAYPNLMNLFFTAYLRKLPSEQGTLVSATERADGSTVADTETTVFINGIQGESVTGDIVNHYLPGGYYCGFPKDLASRKSEDDRDDKSQAHPERPEDPEWYKDQFILKIHDTGQSAPDGNVVNWYNSAYVPTVIIPKAQFTSFTERINSTAGSTDSSYATVSEGGGYDVYIYPIVTATISNPSSGAKGTVTVGVYKTIKQNGSTVDILLAQFVVDATFPAGSNPTITLGVDSTNIVEAGEPTQSTLAVVHSNTLDSPSDSEGDTFYTVRVTNSDEVVSGGDYSGFVSTAVALEDLKPKS